MKNTTFMGNRKGQSMVELALILPVVIALGLAASGVAYVCWQGIKTQEAANAAARVQGQERVGGGRNLDEIQMQNRGFGASDFDPSKLASNAVGGASGSNSSIQPSMDGQDSASVYGRYRKMVRSQFSEKERPSVYVPPPVIGGNTDQIKVVRVINLPTLFGHEFKPIIIESTAYGGEDPRTHALPRWGAATGNSSEPFWKKDLKGND